jgi:hypothetical protein
LLFGTSEKKNFVQNKFDVGELLVDYVSGLSIFFTPSLKSLPIIPLITAKRFIISEQSLDT